MKCVWVSLLTALLLTGCGVQETMETISDIWAEPVMVQKHTLRAELPPEAASPVSDNGGGEWYLCEDYDIVKQTLASGDLNTTVQSLTGYGKEALTIVETQQNGCARYDFVWVSAGESGDCLGRAVILDDGNFHYCLSAMGAVDAAEQYREVWDSMFASVYLD